MRLTISGSGVTLWRPWPNGAGNDDLRPLTRPDVTSRTCPLTPQGFTAYRPNPGCTPKTRNGL
jgi:hypothetical protein